MYILVNLIILSYYTDIVGMALVVLFHLPDIYGKEWQKCVNDNDE